MLRKRAGGVDGGNIAVTDQLAKKKIKGKEWKSVDECYSNWAFIFCTVSYLISEAPCS